MSNTINACDALQAYNPGKYWLDLTRHTSVNISSQECELEKSTHTHLVPRPWRNSYESIIKVQDYQPRLTKYRVSSKAEAVVICLHDLPLCAQIQFVVVVQPTCYILHSNIIYRPEINRRMFTSVSVYEWNITDSALTYIRIWLVQTARTFINILRSNGISTHQWIQAYSGNNIFWQ